MTLTEQIAALASSAEMSINEVTRRICADYLARLAAAQLVFDGEYRFESAAFLPISLTDDGLMQMLVAYHVDKLKKGAIWERIT